MKKDIQRQLYRMIFVVLLLAVFVTWQHEFVMHGIRSSTFLNSIIIGTFLFGLSLTFINLLELDNERIAIEALQESYNDLLHKDLDQADPNRRFRRCEQPAIIFSPPHIMGQSYSLIADEMSRSGDLKMSAATMQTLIDGIDARLEEKRSLVTYLAGLLVFLGLLGTFVGLLETLASVSTIIGDLDLGGSSGMETIARLMENLKGPLKGMATGFSASLFGLSSSLTLGLVSRFQNSGAVGIKLVFEGWLNSVVQITDSHEGGGAGGTVSDRAARVFGEQHLRLMYNVARYTLTSTNRTNRILDAMSKAVSELSEDHRKHNEETHRLASIIEKSAQYQALMSYHLGRTADALAGHDEMSLTLKEVDIALNGRLDELSRAVSRNSGNIESLTEEIIRLSEGGEDDLDSELKKMMNEIDAAFARDRIDRAMAEAATSPDGDGGKPARARALPAGGDGGASANALRDSANPVREMREQLMSAVKAGLKK